MRESASSALTAAIEQLAAACERAAAGDLEARVVPAPTDPALARLARAVNRLLDVSDAYVRESAAAMEHCARGQYHRPIVERGLLGAYRKSAGTINAAALKMMTDAEKIARFEAERARVARRVADTTEVMSTSTQGLKDSAATIYANAGETRRLSHDVAQSADRTASNTNAVAAACQQLSSCTTEISRQTTATGQLTRNAVGEAAKAREVVAELGEAARQIGSIADVITKIARQTNLLALNAGVEAARAGEAGKGFAVVASEVRELAQRSAKAAKEIKALITTSSDQVKSGVDLVDRTGRALQTIVERVQDIDRNVAAIVEASREQTIGIKEINQAVGTLDQGTQQNAASVEEQNAASHQLAERADALAALIGQFRTSGAAPITTAPSRLKSFPASTAAAARPAPARAARPAPAPAAPVKKVANGGDWEEF